MRKPNNKKFWNFKALDEKMGELTLYGEISDISWWGDEVTPKQFKEDLDALGDIDVLNVYINSPGGDVFAGQTIHSILKRHQAKVNVYVDGLAASIASVIAIAGDTVTMPRNAMMMIHNPWTIAIGNAEEFRKLADDLDKIGESLIEAYLSKVNVERDKLIELMNAETWLTAEECKDYGFCDEIEEAKQVAACVNRELLTKYKKTPAKLLATNEPNPNQDKDEEVKAKELKDKKIKLGLQLELI